MKAELAFTLDKGFVRTFCPPRFFFLPRVKQEKKVPPFLYRGCDDEGLALFPPPLGSFPFFLINEVFF